VAVVAVVVVIGGGGFFAKERALYSNICCRFFTQIL
jgi:hypothetical protein